MDQNRTEQTTDMSTKPALLQMENICKEFPGVKALDNVSLTVRAGTVHALMGENGAGKSTLMKCLFGIYHKGRRQIHSRTRQQGGQFQQLPSNALDHGVAMVHQELNQVRSTAASWKICGWAGSRMKAGHRRRPQENDTTTTKDLF